MGKVLSTSAHIDIYSHALPEMQVQATAAVDGTYSQI
jgi:hypothetical protein